MQIKPNNLHKRYFLTLSKEIQNHKTNTFLHLKLKCDKKDKYQIVVISIRW